MAAVVFVGAQSFASFVMLGVTVILKLSIIIICLFH